MKHILNYVSCIINNKPLQSCKVTNETIIFRVNLFKGKGIKILPSKLVQKIEKVPSKYFPLYFNWLLKAFEISISI